MIKDYKIILASNSPRRRELLKGLDLKFEVKTIEGIDESYPDTLKGEEIPLYIARKKGEAYAAMAVGKTMVITADTVVCVDSEVLGKPLNREDAIRMLRTLSGRKHLVITGVCIKTQEKEVVFSSVSEVTFAKLSQQEIEYYVDNYKPMDKAGAYGIQEWIGYVGVEHISGSFYNIMGLPVQRLYTELKKF